MSDIDVIREILPQEELLAQLAEEASELAHAALKLRRVYDGRNYTPVTESEAIANLQEEIADVQLVVTVLRLEMNLSDSVRDKSGKLKRWIGRLKGVSKDGQE